MRMPSGSPPLPAKDAGPGSGMIAETEAGDGGDADGPVKSNSSWEAGAGISKRRQMRRLESQCGGLRVLFIVRVLRGWRSFRRQHGAEPAFLFRFLHCRAGYQEAPVITVIETEKHFAFWRKHRGDWRAFYAWVIIIRIIARIRKQRVSLLASVRLLAVVTKFKRMVKLKTDGFDDEFRQLIKRPLAAKHEVRGEISVPNFEVVLDHESYSSEERALGKLHFIMQESINKKGHAP